MADLVSDGMVKVSWCPNIANIHAPTTAELAAGTSLESFIVPGGLSDKADTKAVDTSALDSVFDTSAPGRVSYDIAITFKRKTPAAADVAYNLLPRGTAGFLIIRRTLPKTTAYTAGQSCEVYPATTGQRQLQDPAANEVAKFITMFFMSDEPDTDAVIA